MKVYIIDLKMNNKIDREGRRPNSTPKAAPLCRVSVAIPRSLFCLVLLLATACQVLQVTAGSNLRDLEDSIKEKYTEVKEVTVSKGKEVFEDVEKAVKLDHMLPLSALEKGISPASVAPSQDSKSAVKDEYEEKLDGEDMEYLEHEREVAQEMAAHGDSTYLSE